MEFLIALFGLIVFGAVCSGEKRDRQIFENRHNNISRKRDEYEKIIDDYQKSMEVLDLLHNFDYYVECEEAAYHIIEDFQEELISEYHDYLTDEDIDEMYSLRVSKKDEVIMYALAKHGLCHKPSVNSFSASLRQNCPKPLYFMSYNQYLIPWVCNELRDHGVNVKAQREVESATNYATGKFLLSPMEEYDNSYYRTCMNYHFLPQNAIRRIEEEKRVRRR